MTSCTDPGADRYPSQSLSGTWDKDYTYGLQAYYSFDKSNYNNESGSVTGNDLTQVGTVPFVA
jgi:hypothetical protein